MRPQSDEPEPADLFRPASDAARDPSTTAVPQQKPTGKDAAAGASSGNGSGRDVERTVAVGAVTRSGDTSSDGSPTSSGSEPKDGDAAKEATGEPPTTMNRPVANQGGDRRTDQSDRSGARPGTADRTEKPSSGAVSGSSTPARNGQSGAARPSGNGRDELDRGGAPRPPSPTRTN